MSSCKNILRPINNAFYDNSTNFNDVSLGSEHPGGTQVLFADGAVRFISETVDLMVYKSTASIDGEETDVLSF